MVIPVRNEVEGIEATLLSILRQDVSGHLEIIVADGMSDDGTRDVLDELRRRHPGLRVVDNPSGRTPAGLNIAMAASTGDVLVRCDGHAELDPGYIARAVSMLDMTGAANVGGVQRAKGHGSLQRAIAVSMSTVLGVGDARFHRGGKPGPVDTVYLGVFRRSVLEEVGTYDESLVRNQDYELNHRIRQAGHTVYFDPELQVTYRPRRTLGALASQYFQYGRWKRLVIGRNPGSLRWRQVVPPIFVVSLLVSIILVGLRSPVGLVVPVAYALGVALTVMWESVVRRDPAVALVAIVLPIMHVAWGSGFLLGRADADEPRVGAIG